jgi:hypothetical protein
MAGVSAVLNIVSLKRSLNPSATALSDFLIYCQRKSLFSLEIKEERFDKRRNEIFNIKFLIIIF